MTWHALSERWPLYLDAAARRWPEVPRAELEATVGRRDLLARRLCETYDCDEEEAHARIEAWLLDLSASGRLAEAVPAGAPAARSSRLR